MDCQCLAENNWLWQTQEIDKGYDGIDIIKLKHGKWKFEAERVRVTLDNAIAGFWNMLSSQQSSGSTSIGIISFYPEK